MKLTVMHWQNEAELSRALNMVTQYRASGYADGSRPRQRNGVIFANSNGGSAALVWGGPEHIRVQFPAPSLTEETTK